MKLEKIFESSFLFEMSNLSKEDTGLDKTIWVSVKNHSSGPRIKVNYDNSLKFDNNYNFSVSISDDPKVISGNTEENVIKKIGKSTLEDIFDWILLNQEILLKYWNSEITTREMLNSIKGI
jgi:hypothetical protein